MSADIGPSAQYDQQAKSGLSPKQKQAVYYDRNARDRPTLRVGQTVRAKFSDHDWRKGEIYENCQVDLFFPAK